jgi:UDP-N-acetylmuramoylalanine--D-glutamate ligase
VQRAHEQGVEVIGDIELFARTVALAPEHKRPKVVAITGTNGKSTTTAMVGHMLASAGRDARVGGNIGLGVLGLEDMHGGAVYVLELSSYQLDLTQSLDCDVAVLLNITPDHLDRYESFEHYSQAKQNLFEMQSMGQVALFARDDHEAFATMHCLAHPEMYGELWRNLKAFELADASRQSLWPALQGPHNAQNASAAISVSQALGVDDGLTEQALRTFPGLPHRMERVAERNGAIFVNDSKATNPTAAAPALAAFPAIRWICGGRPKGDDLDECEPHFGHVRSAYTIGEAAELFERLLKPHMPVKNCRELEVAVKAAADDAEAGDTVLLSPACASFDQFKDFEERGDKFRGCVGAL